MSREGLMKVLFLPVNVASLPSITAAALNKRDDVNALCITQTVHKYQSLSSEVKYLPYHTSKRNPFLWIWDKLFYKYKIKKWLDWADVIHYMWSPALENGFDLKWAYRHNKAIFVEWVGSDIRNPEALKKINPFYREAWNNGYEYADYESELRSNAAQELFAKYGAIPLLWPEMKLFVKTSLFKEHHLVLQRFNVAEFTPVYPSIVKKKPLIVHSPSAKVTKGSSHILKAIDALRKKYDFDFELLHNMPRNKVLERMAEADIFIDQIILGSYGMAAIEAMSLGKPVLCFILPQLYDNGLPLDCPVVNVNQETIEGKLAELIEDAEQRNHIGKQSRLFVEQHHNVDTVSEQLNLLYKDALSKKKTERRK